MSVPPNTNAEERFLVLAPTGRDAQLTSTLLRQGGFDAWICADMNDVCKRVENEGALGLMIAEEALGTRALQRLQGALWRQPSWSDLPILLFMGRIGEPSRAPSTRLIEALGNLTLLERPLRPITMLSAANATLRARRRQYTAREELKKHVLAVQQRDQFLAMLGHELRNPLSAIVMAVELEDDGTAQYKTIVRRQARHLARLVDDLLDVSRVTTGKIVLQRVPVDVAVMVTRSLQPMQTAVAKSGLTLCVRTPREPVVVLADPVRLEQILVNLLNNATKYTPEGGHIELSVRGDSGQVEIAVSDDGVGIAADMLPRVFDLFTQVEATLDRAKGGMGIGLTLVKNLVELHDGTIEVSSAGHNGGTRFVVRLPRVFAQDASPSQRPSAKVATPAPREVIVVEDNEDSRTLLAAMLKRCGHKVLDVGDGQSGVDVALRTHPSAMLVDIGLPGLDGYGVARHVRRALGQHVLLVALTGYGQPEDRARALAAGFDEHLTKPVDFGQLQELLARAEVGVSSPHSA